MNWEMIGAIVTVVVAVVGGLTFIINKVFNLGSLANRLKTAEVQLDELSKEVKFQHDEVIKIQTTLAVKYKNAEGLFTQRHSPRSLNELGLKIFNDMNGQEFLDKNKDFLFKKIDARRPMAALDVEEAAEFVCSSSTNEEFFLPVKSFVYNYPEVEIAAGRKHDLTLSDACYILSFPLRDMYLKEHPNMI